MNQLLIPSALVSNLAVTVSLYLSESRDADYRGGHRLVARDNAGWECSGENNGLCRTG